MTNFRPTTLSPEALKVWDEAEAIIQESVERIRELTAPLRRPNPPSLKELALARTDAILNDPNRALLVEVRETLELNRRALEALPND